MKARVLVAVVALASFAAVAQSPSPPTGLPKGIVSPSPKAFFEIADKSFLLKKEVVVPKTGVPMIKLTEFEDLDAARAFSATADVAGLGAASDPTSNLARTKLRQIVNDKTLASVRVVALDIDRIDDFNQADAPSRLCDFGAPYCGSLKTRGWRKADDGSERLVVSLSNDSPGAARGQAVLIRDDTGVYGTLNVGARVHLLRELKDGVFAITEPKTSDIERSRDDVFDLTVPKGSRPSKDGAPKEATADSSRQAFICPNPTTRQIVDVMVMWTKKAEDLALRDGHKMLQLVRNAEAIANLSFTNSDINGEIRVTRSGRIDYEEQGVPRADLLVLLEPNGKLKLLRDARRQLKADVAVLIVDVPSPTNCGIAAGISIPKDKAYAVVNWRCVTDKFSFIHEIGHLAGAWHDPQTLDMEKCEVDPPYACGYVTKGPEPWATIMAYRESCSAPCGRGWYWSNPEKKTDDGQVLGTVEGNYDACIWRKRLPEMSTFDGG